MATVLSETKTEAERQLQECERKIEAALGDAWHALRRIHDEKLYKASGFGSFKDYCEKRWGYSKTHAHRLIDHSRIVEYLKTQGVEVLPTTERQTRALTQLRRSSKSDDDFLQKAGNAWEIAVDTAPKKFDYPEVTGEHVESAMAQFGIHGRKAKPKGDPVADELKGILMRFRHCAAFQEGDGYDFVKKHGSKCLPADFLDIVQWLQEVTEVSADG